MVQSENSLIRLFILNIKAVYGTNANRVIIFLTPILVTLALAIVLPIQYYLVMGMMFSIPVSAGTIFGITYFPLRKTTIYDNLMTSNNKQIYLYISIWFTMMFVTLISMFELLLTSFIFLVAGLARTSLFPGIDGAKYSFEFSRLDWWVIFYYWFICNAFVFSVSFISRLFIHNSFTYFICLLTVMVYQIPFGGLLPSTFALSGDSWQISATGESLFGLPIGKWYSSWNFFSVMTFLNPQAHLNILMYESSLSGTLNVSDTANTFTSMNGAFEHNAFNWDTSWLWDYVLLMPPLFISFLGLISLTTLRK